MNNRKTRHSDFATAARRCLSMIMVSLAVGVTGCKKDSPTGPVGPQLPALSDAIPFEQLGEGKLVFQRIGPFANNYSGAYVLDVAQKLSWAIGGNINSPAVSPDGQKIVYTSYTSVQTAYDVYIMSSDGSGQQRVSDIAGQENWPSWTYDGKQILYTAFPFSLSDGFTPLYRQSPVANPTDRVVVVDPGKQSLPFGIEGPVSVSSTGKILCTDGGIHTLAADGSGLTLLIPKPGLTEQLYSATWSPDGQNIALLSIRRDTTNTVAVNITSVAVVLYTATGTSPDTLVSLPASGTTEWAGGNSYSLCWSPDGSRVAFTRPDGKNVGSHIFVIRKDGTGLTQVTFAEGVTDRSVTWGK